MPSRAVRTVSKGTARPPAAGGAGHRRSGRAPVPKDAVEQRQRVGVAFQLAEDLRMGEDAAPHHEDRPGGACPTGSRPRLRNRRPRPAPAPCGKARRPPAPWFCDHSSKAAMRVGHLAFAHLGPGHDQPIDQIADVAVRPSDRPGWRHNPRAWPPRPEGRARQAGLARRPAPCSRLRGLGRQREIADRQARPGWRLPAARGCRSRQDRLANQAAAARKSFSDSATRAAR